LTIHAVLARYGLKGPTKILRRPPSTIHANAFLTKNSTVEPPSSWHATLQVKKILFLATIETVGSG
jgi:hypothetical protein